MIPIVIVRGGVVQDVISSKSCRTINYEVIDYDGLESGECPACREPLVIENGNFSCKCCGYDEDLDNAIQCKIKLLEDGDKS